MKKKTTLIIGILVALLIYSGQFPSMLKDRELIKRIEERPYKEMKEIPIRRVTPATKSVKKIIIIA